MRSTTYVHIWEFTVAPEFAADFERHYGSDGTWAQLFSRSPDYLGTSLLKNVESGRYLTIDRWRNEEAYRLFRSEYAMEYGELDKACERFTTDERSLGTFNELPPAESTGKP